MNIRTKGGIGDNNSNISNNITNQGKKKVSNFDKGERSYTKNNFKGEKTIIHN